MPGVIVCCPDLSCHLRKLSSVAVACTLHAALLLLFPCLLLLHMLLLVVVLLCLRTNRCTRQDVSASRLWPWPPPTSMSNEQRGRTNHRKCCERLCQFKDGVLLLNFVVDWMAVIIIGRESKSEEYWKGTLLSSHLNLRCEVFLLHAFATDCRTSDVGRDRRKKQARSRPDQGAA